MTLLKTVGFSLLLCLLFFAVTRMLPQVEGEAPMEQKIDPAALTMEEFVALGEHLFNSSTKGNCTLCHKPPPLGRAPDLIGNDMVAVATKRLADKRYKGTATDAESYLRESMKAPSKYVVATWGEKGSNDTKSPMPAAHKPPAQLSDLEIDAIIAYLQSKDGHEITVELPAGSPSAVAPIESTTPVPVATVEEVLKKYGCEACHIIDGAGGMVGPSLADVGNRLTAEQIRESIIAPDAVIAEGFVAGIMPADFAARMTINELEMIVKLLVEQKP